MCGIVGGWCSHAVDEGVVERSMRALKHRGPDDHGKYFDSPAFLAMRRLAIIGVDGGQQPIFSEDRQTVVVCNGEIYNYKELATELKGRGHRFSTNSDTEVLVHLYEEYGDDLCQELRGMYAFAIWDVRRRRLLLGRDRFGQKPLYYARTNQGDLYFASEIKALHSLLHAAGESVGIDDQAIYDYLSLGVVPQPRTIFNGISCLPPACTLSFDGDDPAVRRYWSLDYHSKRHISREEAIITIRERIAESVRLRLRSDVPLGVFLSGGIDSSVVAYEAAKQGGADLTTYTVGSEDRDFDESSIASRTSASLNLKNVVLPMRVDPNRLLETVVSQYDQPFADPSAMPSLAISEVASQHVKVVLNGDGGDELFAGYRRHMAAHLIGKFNLPGASYLSQAGTVAARLVSRRRSAAGFLARIARTWGLAPGEKYLALTTDTLREADKVGIWKGPMVRSTESHIEALLSSTGSALDKQLHGEVLLNLPSDLLVKMDMATSAYSLEARSPLLDHNIAEFVASLPSAMLLRRCKLKSLLRDAYSGLVPDEVLNGPKRGFEINLQSWLANELEEVLMDTLGSRNARVHSYLDGEFIDVLLEGSFAIDRNRSLLIYALLVLELWLRKEPWEQTEWVGHRQPVVAA